MGTYVITGAGSGMGRATMEQLRWEGHKVIGVDLKGTDINVDLSTDAGVREAVQSIITKSEGRVDGAILAAGLGPIPGRGDLIARVNYGGVVGVLEGLHDVLAAAGNAKVVVFSSNSTTTTPGVPREIVQAFFDRDYDEVKRIAEETGGKEHAENFIYAGSKLAVTYWMRTIGVTPKWAGAGIRVNAIAPGAIMTPLLSKQLADPETAQAIKDFPIPVGDFGSRTEVAQWVIFMLSPAANFMCGSVIVIDGGTDAYFRANDYPWPIPMEDAPKYMEKLEAFKNQK